jgi:hypothetical protein
MTELPEPVREALIEILSDFFADLIRTTRPDLLHDGQSAENPGPPQDRDTHLST